MKAAVLYEVGRLVVEDIELDPPREGEVLVRLAASGVCRSDYVRVTGKRPLPLPIVLGHEGAGFVEEVGKGVTGLKRGDRVILSWIAPCGACRYCISGKPNLCTVAVANGAKGVMPDGTRRLHKGDLFIHHMYGLSTFAERAVVPEQAAVKVRSDLDMQVGGPHWLRGGNGHRGRHKHCPRHPGERRGRFWRRRCRTQRHPGGGAGERRKNHCSGHRSREA